MKLALLLSVVALAAQHGGHGAAGAPEVQLRFADVSPAHLTVLVGDRVTWRNTSIRRHTVSSATGGFDSGFIPTDDTYSRVFDTPGDFPYICKLHPSVNGTVSVRSAILEGPPGALAGEQIELHGRAAPGELPLSRDAQQVATIAVGRDGRFSTRVTSAGAATWTVPGADPLRVELIERRDVLLVRDGRRLLVRVDPPAPGALVVLQQRRKERFGWWPLRSTRLGADSRAAFRAPRRRAPVRVVLTQADGATVLAVSNSSRPTRSR